MGWFTVAQKITTENPTHIYIFFAHVQKKLQKNKINKKGSFSFSSMMVRRSSKKSMLSVAYVQEHNSLFRSRLITFISY